MRNPNFSEIEESLTLILNQMIGAISVLKELKHTDKPVFLEALEKRFDKIVEEALREDNDLKTFERLIISSMLVAKKEKLMLFFKPKSR